MIPATLLLSFFLLFALPVQAMEEYNYRVTGKLPHSREDFTQGLEIRDGRLYQGTGRYGHSALQVFDLENGEQLTSKALPPDLFGEGVTVLGNRIVQLTWRSGRALLYDAESLERIGEFKLPGEGWGLTNNGEQLIYSDGSQYLHFIDPESWKVTRSVEVRLKGRPLRYLNELEWTPDYLLANVWGRDWLVMIDPDSGEVLGRAKLRGLLPREERRRSTDVLNGIARDPATGALWVTGKNWPWLYQIELYRETEKALE